MTTYVDGVALGGMPAFNKRLQNCLLIGIPALGTAYSPIWFFHHRPHWPEITSFIIFYVLTGIGVGAGFHRYFSHKSFEPVFPLKVVLLLFGSLAFQGSVVRWVADHRRHHRFSDREWDTHSPWTYQSWQFLSQQAGLFHAHFGWMFDETTTEYAVYAPDVIRDPAARLSHQSYWAFVLLSLSLPFGYGLAFGGLNTAIGCLLAGACLRATALQNVIWAVNSIGHTIGAQEANSRDESRNNRLLAALTFGEGWHNNHHNAPRSAYNNRTGDQFDFNGVLIHMFERLHLARSVTNYGSLLEKYRSVDAG